MIIIVIRDVSLLFLSFALHTSLLPASSVPGWLQVLQFLEFSGDCSVLKMFLWLAYKEIDPRNDLSYSN